MAAPDRTQATYRLELRRAVANGVLEAAGGTFLLLIAVRWFHAGFLAKGLVAAGGSVGLLLTPVAVSQVARLGWSVGVAASRFAAVGSACFVIMALIPWLPLYAAGCVLTMAAASAAVPLITQIYQENYPEAQRGRLFARTVMLRIAVAASFSVLAGKILSTDINRSRWLLWMFALAFAAASHWLRQYPPTHLTAEGGSHPFRAMRYVREDPLFRHTLVCWMLMGFGNLMMLPMRVEYLANPKYAMHLETDVIALLVGVIPNVARLLMSQIWGWLFDRMNFFLLRVVLNAGFALGILTFFFSDSMAGLVTGAIIFGISNAGGDVAWGLWVTKLAPPDRVADYMSIHTFFTGVRGSLAPLVAFGFARHLPITYLGVVSTALIISASLLLLPEARQRRALGRARVLTEGVSE